MVLGITLDELYENWHFFMKSATWSRINGLPAPEKYGESLDKGVSKAAVSPDGKTLAYIKGNHLVLRDIGAKKKSEILSKNFQTQGSGLAWSPDGKFLAYCSEKDGEYVLSNIEISSRKTCEYRIPKMPSVYSPSWSPDQKYLIF